MRGLREVFISSLRCGWDAVYLKLLSAGSQPPPWEAFEVRSGMTEADSEGAWSPCRYREPHAALLLRITFHLLMTL